MKTVGMVTIGQSPRDDVVPEMEKLLGPDFRVVQAGALDGLTRDRIALLAPGAGDDALTTRLRDGDDVIVAKGAIIQRLQDCLDRLEHEVDAFLILCTGNFPAFPCRRPVLEPDRILAGAAQGVFDGRHLGVLIPIPEQREGSGRRWSALAGRRTVAVASPYRGPADLARAAEELKRAGVSLVVMDCMGYTQAMKTLVRDVVAVPVLLPSSVVARIVAEVA